MTDLVEIQENLRHNIDRNSDLIESMGGSATSQVLDWKDEEQAARDFENQTFEVGKFELRPTNLFMY